MYGKFSTNGCGSSQKCADFLCHQVHCYGCADCCILRLRIALCCGLCLRSALCINIQISACINRCSTADLCIYIVTYQRYRNCCIQGIILSIILIRRISRSTVALCVFVSVITSFHIRLDLTVNHRFHSEITLCRNVAACNFCVCRRVRDGQSKGSAHANTLVASAIATVSSITRIAISRFRSLKTCACACLGGHLLIYFRCYTAVLISCCCQISIYICSISSVENVDCHRSGYAYVRSACTGDTDHFDGIGCFFSITVSRHSRTNQEITSLMASGNLRPVY